MEKKWLTNNILINGLIQILKLTLIIKLRFSGKQRFLTENDIFTKYMELCSNACLDTNFTANDVKQMIGSRYTVTNTAPSMSCLDAIKNCLLQTKQFKQLSRLELLIALMCVAIGLFLIFNSTILLAILPIAAGIIIMLDALIQIGDGFKLKK